MKSAFNATSCELKSVVPYTTGIGFICWQTSGVSTERVACFSRLTSGLKPKFRTCAYQGVRNVCLSEILARFAFLKRPF